MTCYIRHLKQLFKVAGIENSFENHRWVHRQLQLRYREDECPMIWNRVKSSLREAAGVEVLARELASAHVME